MAAQEQLGSQEAESPAEREQLLEQYMAPLAAEAEGLFGRLSEQYAQHDISTLSEQEIDRLFESLQPSFEHLSPAFENLFGGLCPRRGSLTSTFLPGSVRTGIVTKGGSSPG